MITLLLVLAMPPSAAHDRPFWLSIVKSDYAVPPGEKPFELLVEMNALVGSPDPVLRDDVSYGAAARWIYRRRLLSADEQKRLLQLWSSNLSMELGRRGSDTAYRRSFSALNLSVLAALDNEVAFLTQAEFEAFLNRSIDYLVHERDTRGYVPGHGWIHATAHTADLLKFLARSPKLPPPAQRTLLNAIAQKCAGEETFAWGEEERLAEIVRSIVRRPDFDAAAFAAWLGEFPLRHTELWKTAPAIDPAAFPPVQNIKSVLRAAYVALVNDANLPTPGQTARQSVLQTLAMMK